MTVSEYRSHVESLMRQVATELSGLGYTYQPTRENFHRFVVRAYNGIASASISARQVSFASALALLVNQEGGSDSATRRTLDGLIADLLNALQAGGGGGGGGSFLELESGAGHFQEEDASGSVLLEAA